MKDADRAEGEQVPERGIGLSRRSLLKAMLAGAAAPALSKTGWGRAAARNPLYFPPTIYGGNVSLTCAPAQANLGGGRISNVLAYNGTFPAPTLAVRKGQFVNVVLHNGLAQETITHWHGMIVDEQNDGGPHMAIPPNGSHSYSYPVVNRAGLNFYHPHPHRLTGEQVCLGLAGALIVRDAEEDALGLPGSLYSGAPPLSVPRTRAMPFSSKYEVPLILRDANFDGSGNLRYNPGGNGFFGDTPLVNGTIEATLSVDASVYRFRVLNGSNARVMRLALSNGSMFRLIGNDGGLLEFGSQVGTFVIGPGERLDVLVDFRGYAVGTSVMLRDLDANWDLIEFLVTSSHAEGNIPSGRLSTIERLANPVRTRTFEFEGMNKVNGRSFDMNRIDFQVPFGEVERWILTTRGTAPHPVHIHGASFQVRSRTGGRGQVFPWEAGWKDTVLLLDAETVEVLIRFDRQAYYSGPQRYVIHCHKLEHEDAGMMSNFVVN
ncbi:MAG: Multicopper oxidase mco [Fimbriimonadales bacterium]|nr:Multicopper oxidase mco [Fimbriimonadales bacterium]